MLLFSVHPEPEGRKVDKMLTLKKVKEMVKAPAHTKRVPSPKVLLEEGRIFLRKEFEHGSHLTLYHNGYVWFSAGKRNTVFHIHDCRGDYLELEKELDKQIRQMESTHPGYDEYRYQLDEIGHDPYQLISHLTAVYEQFTRGQVKPVIEELFKQQYLLKVWETIEIRTRMETRVGIRPTIDAFGNVSMETYTYQEEVEYEYKILNVLLKNKGFDTIARKNMNRKQTGRYDAYNLTYGNRPELFGAGSPTYSGGTTGSIGTGGGTGGSGGGFKYDIPSEALSDEKFARMIEEAEKYLGMPYVWGGSSPSTSFDCSGFVCWVINNSGNGWSVGRTTANGLRGKCSYVSPADAKPGDLIFFEKTYNTVGASHVGIYVGNGMMIHCGDPISYTSINSTYWQSHFLGFGRIN